MRLRVRSVKKLVLKVVVKEMFPLFLRLLQRWLQQSEQETSLVLRLQWYLVDQEHWYGCGSQQHLDLLQKFSECMLAIKYREVNAKGEMSGGPMYTMKKRSEK